MLCAVQAFSWRLDRRMAEWQTWLGSWRLGIALEGSKAFFFPRDMCLLSKDNKNQGTFPSCPH